MHDPKRGAPRKGKPSLVGQARNDSQAPEPGKPTPQEQSASEGVVEAKPNRPGFAGALNGANPSVAAKKSWESRPAGLRQYSLVQIQAWKQIAKNALEQGFTFDKGADVLHATVTSRGELISKKYSKSIIQMVAQEWEDADRRVSKFSKAKAIRLAHEAVRQTRGIWVEATRAIPPDPATGFLGSPATPGHWARKPSSNYVAALDHLARLEGTYTPERIEIGRSEMEAKFGFFMTLPPEKQKHYLEAAEAKLKTG